MRKIIVVTLLALVSLVGLSRLGFDTDILGMLPDEVPEVYGLKAYRDVLEKGGALIVTLQCDDDDAGLLEDEAESLADYLKEKRVVGEARWRPVFEEDPDGLGELIAYLWLNGSEAQWNELIDELGESKSKVRLEQSVNRLGTVMDMSAMQLSARDPFDFFKHDSTKIFESDESGGSGYASDDGRLHLVFVRPVDSVSGYKMTKRWIRQVQEAAKEWRQSGDRAWVEIAYTGGPVFTSEVGEGMEGDVRGTVGLTLVLVSLLFWYMQRNIKLLLALAGMLVLIFAITLGMASLMYGNLSMLSVGFASILIGLAVDYGMVICQEARVQNQTETELRAAVTKGIVWAAITTSAVFAALLFSSLPGIRQLGALVALGILTGSVVMLVVYVPIVSRMNPSPIEPDAESAGGQPRHPVVPPRVASVVLVSVILLSAVVIGMRGLPRITFDFAVMQPSYSPGMEAMRDIKDRMPAWNSMGLQVVVEADSDERMLQHLQDAQARVDAAAQRGDVGSGVMPVGLWPDWQRQQANRSKLGVLLASRDRLVAEAHEVGFSDQGMSLSLAVLDSLESFRDQSGIVYPQGEAALEILQGYLWRGDEGGGLARGSIVTDVAAAPAKEDLVLLRELNGQGAYVSGWSLLSPAVLPMIHRDVTHIFVPMGAILLMMLVIVFRDIRDVLLVSCCLAAPMLIVISAMRLMGINWDMLNIVAVPLLLGMGMDYGIHMVMALRRHAEQPHKVWHGIGKALMFCGVSTAIGFGSLATASNTALADMGTLCAIGILLTMGCSVFIMPGAWRMIHRKAGFKSSI